jgi:hypothetical protein
VRPRSIRLTIVALSVFGFFGCGGRSAVGPDGGAAPPDGGGADGDAQLDAPDAVAQRRAFDVTASLGPADAGTVTNLPLSNTFTLVLDVAAGQAIVGGAGRAAVVSATSSDGRTFHIGKFSVGFSANSCSGVTSLDYATFDLTLNGATLQGTAVGAAQVSCGDCLFSVPFVADVAGVPDVTPPVLVAGADTVPSNPFLPFTLVASEPLPVTATARLTATDGSHVDLLPTILAGAPALVTGFSKPDVVLSYGQGFVVTFEGLVDFAGHRGAADPPLRLVAFSPPPLVAGDGFESVTAAQVGGAAVIGAGGPLPPISGARSAYISAPGLLSPDGTLVGSALRVRLAVPAGATKLRFSTRSVSMFLGGGFAGVVNVGSVGHGKATAAITMSGLGAPAVWPPNRTVLVTSVAPQELALPPDATDEVLVDFDTSDSGCGLPLPPGGLLIDDLRVE